MAFLGALNHKLRQYFYEQAPALDGRDVYIGCSGNFTFEQLLSRRAPQARLYSNDVSLYSATIGHALTGEPFPFEFTAADLLWANEYADRGPAERVSVMLMVLEMLKYEKRTSAYAERMWAHYMTNRDAYYEETLKKVRVALASIRIETYTMQDVYDYFPKPGGVNVGLLPTYAGDYEKMFERLDRSVRWNRPRYTMLDAERREETVRRMCEGEYILYDIAERDLPCVAQVELFRRKPVYIYSNLRLAAGVYRRRLKERIVPYRLLMPEDEIGAEDTVAIVSADSALINHYRFMFMAKSIQPSDGGPNLLFFVGGKLFGCAVFQPYSKKGRSGDRTIYVLSDFIVPSAQHRRLAKLLLMALKCHEVRAFLETSTFTRYDRLLTTAFTKRPVSMKYRGVFDLVKRGEGFLNYGAEFGPMSLKEVVREWLKRYEKR